MNMNPGNRQHHLSTPPSSGQQCPRILALGLLLAAVTLTGCATLPDAAPAKDSSDVDTSALRSQLLGSIEDEAQLDFAHQIAHIEHRLSGRPLMSGNHVDLLTDGPSTHELQLTAIAGAQHHIHLEMYIITDAEIGRRYAKALIDKAESGVEVRLLYDGIGAFDAKGSFLRRLRRAGVEIHEFNPVSPWRDLRLWRINRRNHRKMLIVDGKVAFTGGVNISDDYSSSPFATQEDVLADNTDQPRHVTKPERTEGWRDTHLRIQGPGVAQLQWQFLRNWNNTESPTLPFLDPVLNLLDPILPSLDDLKQSPEYFPPLPQAGDEQLRVLTSDGADFIDVMTGGGKDMIAELLGESRDHHYAIYKSYLSAMLLAQERIWITQAYFAPNEEFLDALKSAARRGVDVRLLVPGESDVNLMLHASRYFYQRLLDAGVTIYEYDLAMIHAKTAVIDGVWSTVGSSNLDFRSFLHNDEANVIVLGSDFGRQMEDMFLNDIGHGYSRKIDPEHWARRPEAQKAKERSAALTKYWI